MLVMKIVLAIILAIVSGGGFALSQRKGQSGSFMLGLLELFRAVALIISINGWAWWKYALVIVGLLLAFCFSASYVEKNH